MSEQPGSPSGWGRRILIAGVVLGIASLAWVAFKVIRMVSGVDPVEPAQVMTLVIQAPFALILLSNGRLLRRPRA